MDRRAVTVAVVVLGLVLAAYLWLFGRSTRASDAVAAERCQRAYAAARTAAESVAVDRRVFVAGRTSAEGVSCASLRHLERARGAH